MRKYLIFLNAFFLIYTFDLMAKQTIKLCTVDWPPFTIVEKDSGKISGIHVDITHEIFKRVDLNVEIQSIPWKRCLKMVEDGHLDGVFAVSYNEDRARYLLYPKEPLDTVEYIVATMEDPKKVKWSTKKVFSSPLLPVGSPQGYSVTADLKKEKGIKVDDGAVNDRANFQKMLGDRVKSIVMLRQALEQMIKSDNIASKVHVLEPPYVDGKKYFIGIRKTYREGDIDAAFLLKAIDETLKHLVETKKIKPIRDKYYSDK